MAFEGLSEKLQHVLGKLSNRGRLTEVEVKAAMREVKLALLEADVNFKVVKGFIKNVTERAVGEDVLTSLTPGQQVIKIVRDELVHVLGDTNEGVNFSANPPTIIMMCGLQGAGKTTMCGKLAQMWIQDGKKVMLVALDIYRPAAIDQLKIVAEQSGADFFEQGQQDVVKTAKQALSIAESKLTDIVILDTAGRLHIDSEMMDELIRVADKVKPHEKLLVVDAMTGQDAVNAATAFNESLELDGVVITKLDGDSRGGAAISVKAVTGKPIKFAGIGEKLSDVEVFHPDRMAGRILGMGDMLTLIEKAEKSFDETQAAELERKIRKAEFTLEDFLEQMGQLKNMGGIEDMLAMMPGGNKFSGMQLDEKQMAQTEAIIQSMTMDERRRPNIIGGGRKKRIARGSGTKVQDVNRLLTQFEQMKKMMKSMTKRGGKGMQMPF
ncbi:MAG: signal recognition particle protein [Clostridia bacterium]|jgi:signal recognition particle subunit SRP54|nr:signal recognition particle protein [Clostridia bacterium]MBT7123188.1 signal recognition particle protein [Clostridia bacterium]